jgi:sulfite reductase (NADPH) flavoprotein alpha-component
MKVSLPPLSIEKSDWLHRISEELNAEQLMWLSGYSYGLSVAKQSGNETIALSTPPAQALKQQILEQQTFEQPSVQSAIPLTILYGSHTGNSKRVALRTAERAQVQGLDVRVYDMREYPLKQLKIERAVLVVVSTHGEGEPPVAAEDFYHYIHSARAPKLPNTTFAVLALGDRSYLHFCKTGADVDAQLEKLGATRLLPRIDCDVDFDDDAERWTTDVLHALSALAFLHQPHGVQKERQLTPTITLTSGTVHLAPRFSKKQPFAAPLLEKIQLNGRGSTKETYHVELGLEHSGIVYEPGDALGIIADNAPTLVEEVLTAARLSGDTPVTVDGTTLSLYEALQTRYELTVLNRHTLQEHLKYTKNKELEALLTDTNRLQAYLYGTDVVDMLQQFPAEHTAETLTATLRKLPPRLYSIASSLKEHEDEVHLTVAAVRYQTPSAHGTRRKEGLASCFVADRTEIGSCLRVYLERNESFKLPLHPDTDIIMIGAGTGVAPFRAFVEERAATGATGRNWLLFGNPHFTTDFLYQLEWQQWLKKGVLTKLNVAFSRDQAEKIYVQHKLLAHSKEVFAWIEQGATLYVCGDKHRMAKDVETALRCVVQHEAGISAEHAATYLQTLKKQKRYCEDVY